MAAPRFRRLNVRDDVAVAVDAAPALSVCAVGDAPVALREDVPAGHKVALRAIAAGSPVVKYGYSIGVAKADIPAGAWVHTHNVGTGLSGTLEYAYKPTPAAAPVKSAVADPHFLGYRRANGKVGVRNEIWILPTVGCVNAIAGRLVELARTRLAAKLAKTDGIFFFPHPFGCSQLGADHETTRTILLDLARHPNAGGVLVLGLGCENNVVKTFMELLGPVDGKRVKHLVTQDSADELEDSLALIEQLVDAASADKREKIPASELVVGMKCGGSDGFSGITANPLVGSFSDRLTAAGGTTILTEVPEMFGAETILMDRCRNRETFDKTVHLINDFKEYFIAHDQVVYENPSPGNKDGGITTLEDKSLGCVQKGGTAQVTAVYPYGGIVDQKGLVLLSGPGNDIVSVTALSAAGAHVVLFTTGRGTPLGGPVPTVKVSSNTKLAEHKAGWIDFNAGRLLDAGTPDAVRAVEDEFFQYVLDVASGKQVRNEINGYREIAIFKDGVTL